MFSFGRLAYSVLAVNIEEQKQPTEHSELEFQLQHFGAWPAVEDSIGDR
jgi:hypothetical protein